MLWLVQIFYEMPWVAAAMKKIGVYSVAEFGLLEFQCEDNPGATRTANPTAIVTTTTWCGAAYGEKYRKPLQKPGNMWPQGTLSHLSNEMCEPLGVNRHLPNQLIEHHAVPHGFLAVKVGEALPSAL